MALDATCFPEIFLKDVRVHLKKKKKEQQLQIVITFYLLQPQSHTKAGESPHTDLRRTLKKKKDR